MRTVHIVSRWDFYSYTESKLVIIHSITMVAAYVNNHINLFIYLFGNEGY